ncbi:MAG: hypothetical protein AAF704_02460 [Cyanobacteria bacterium P01_D01_bin.123]
MQPFFARQPASIAFVMVARSPSFPDRGEVESEVRYVSGATVLNPHFQKGNFRTSLRSQIYISQSMTSRLLTPSDPCREDD